MRRRGGLTGERVRAGDRGGTGGEECEGPRCGGHAQPDRLSGSDRGSATVWSLGAIAVLCVVFGAVLALGQAVVVRHRAAGGADLAALAAADHWAEGGTAACARAERLAAAQGVRLVRCAIVGDTSEVTAAAGRGPFTAEVRARAGPAAPVPPGVSDGSAVPGVPDGSLGGPTGATDGSLGGPTGATDGSLVGAPDATGGSPGAMGGSLGGPPGVPDGSLAVPPGVRGDSGAVPDRS
ncbi:membrane protein [Streptomyces hygroscopicus subsp. limoneus]|nr:membrane protein [Streptomyces hygroscopicus subsp. limoneus]